MKQQTARNFVRQSRKRLADEKAYTIAELMVVIALSASLVFFAVDLLRNLLASVDEWSRSIRETIQRDRVSTNLSMITRYGIVYSDGTLDCDPVGQSSEKQAGSQILESIPVTTENHVRLSINGHDTFCSWEFVPPQHPGSPSFVEVSWPRWPVEWYRE